MSTGSGYYGLVFGARVPADMTRLMGSVYKQSRRSALDMGVQAQVWLIIGLAFSLVYPSCKRIPSVEQALQ